ncbi:MAG: hypothetical protein HC819_04130 [Cyclobacteriaceae bacterium]|nr:hypothetical protein [Cyclobacteriaceae bacterium]
METMVYYFSFIGMSFLEKFLSVFKKGLILGVLLLIPQIGFSQCENYFSIWASDCNSQAVEVAANLYVQADWNVSSVEFTWYTSIDGNVWQWQDWVYPQPGENITVKHDAASFKGQTFYVKAYVYGENCGTSRKAVTVSNASPPILLTDGWQCNESYVRLYVAGGDICQVRTGGQVTTQTGPDRTDFSFDEVNAHYEARVGSNGCYSNWQTVSIGANLNVELPNSVIVEPYCAEGSPANITVNVNGGGVPNPSYTQYNWYDLSGNPITNHYSPIFSIPFRADGYQYEVFSVDQVTGHSCTTAKQTFIPTSTSLTAGGTLENEKQVCYNQAPGELLASAPTGGTDHAYQWQVSNDNTNWSDISGATGITYAPGKLNATKYYRRKVTACGTSLYTNSLKLIVRDYSVYLNVEEISCTSPSELRAVFAVQASGTGVGNYTLMWYKSATDTDYQWQDNVNHNSTSEIIQITHQASPELYGQSLWVSIETPTGCETARQKIDINEYTVPTPTYEAWSCNNNAISLYLAGGQESQVRVNGSVTTEIETNFTFDDPLPYSNYEVRVGSNGCYSSWESVYIGSNLNVALPNSVIVEPYCEASPPDNIHLTFEGGGVPNPSYTQYNLYDLSGKPLKNHYNPIFLMPYMPDGYQYEVFSVDQSTGHSCTSNKAVLSISGRSSVLPVAIDDIVACKWQLIELPIWDSENLIGYKWYDHNNALIPDNTIRGLPYSSYQFTYRGYDGLCESTETGEIHVMITNDCDDNLNWV